MLVYLIAAQYLALLSTERIYKFYIGIGSVRC